MVVWLFPREERHPPKPSTTPSSAFAISDDVQNALLTGHLPKSEDVRILPDKPYFERILITDISNGFRETFF